MFWTVKRGLILVGMLAVIFVGVWAGRPAYRGWQERRAVHQATEFLAAKDYRNAMLAARRALAANPSSVEASRLMADLTETLRLPAALDWRQRLVDLQPNDLTNRLQLARAAILFGNFPRAAQALRAVPATNHNEPAFHQLAAAVAIGLTNLNLAEHHFGEAARLDPTNKLVQLNRAALHLQSTDPTLVQGAVQTLEQLRNDPFLRKDALRHLAQAAARNNDWPRALPLTRELQAEPGAPIEDRLLHLTILQKAGSADFRPYLDGLQAEWAASPAQINALTTWLLGHRMTEEAARWMERLTDEIRSQPPVILARADVLVARKDWTALQALLQERKWGDLDFVRLALLARAAREERQEIAAQANWRAAVKAASEGPKPLTTLAGMTQNWGWEREHEELLWTLLQRWPGEHWVMQSLNQMYLATGNTRGLHKLYATLAAYDPKDLVAANNFAALSLLLNLQTSRAHELARDLYAQSPSNAVFASTYAYSLHLLGRTAEGLQALEALSPARLAQPNIAAYYGVLLAADGRRELAEDYFELASKARLLPEELLLVETARKPPTK
jgi:Flp pilus assembly protein TadD